MKANIRYIILHSLIWLLLIVFLSVSMSFVIKKRNTVVCLGAEIHISEMEEFIDESEVKTILEQKNLFRPGYLCDSINLELVEKTLASHNQVKSVETYVTVDGRLVIRIQQRRPLLRVFNRDNETYYIDEDGKLMQTSSKYTPRVPVANGNIFGSMQKHRSCIPWQSDSCNYEVLQLYQLYCLASAIQRDSFMEALVDQVYINSHSQIELIPKVSAWTITLGDASFLDEKFRNLKTFMQMMQPPDGWDRYTAINLSFKDQIVCTKKTAI